MILRPRTLRGRLAVVFAIVTIVISASVAGFVLLRYRSDLSRQIDENLETRYADVRAALRELPSGQLGGDVAIIPKTEVFAQVLTPAGDILAASPRSLDDVRVLSRQQLASAARRRTQFERRILPRGERARLLAGPERLGQQRIVVVVGASLAESEHAENQLERTLAIALPALAAIVIAAGWVLVGAALRPMRAMVSEAEALSERQPGGRLSDQGPRELAELAQRLNEMLSRIEAALDHERAFVDDASHELRTPIAIARGELELAQPLATGNPAIREAIDSALEEVERLETLALNLLVLARTRAAAPPPREPVDLRQVSEQAVADVQRARDVTDLELSVNGDAVTFGDAPALERAVTNLVDNAARHATKLVTITLVQTADESVIEVRNDGSGFPEAVFGRAGERFVRGTEGGAGLGLAIVDAIAVAHGGRLELVDGAGAVSGAVVRLHLPGAR